MSGDIPEDGALQVIGLAKTVGGRRLWHQVSFTLKPGEIMALRGDSGSGKSTLLNVIGLLADADEGSIIHNGRPLSRRGIGARKTRVNTIGFLFQDYALVEDATVTENLDIAGRPRLFSRARDYSEILDRFGLEGRGASSVYLLSGGEQQRLALARLHVRPTPIILADEPTAALDTRNTRIVLESLTELAAAGRTVIIATHSDSVAAIAGKTLWLGDDGHELVERKHALPS